jgi:hypothetical protein
VLALTVKSGATPIYVAAVGPVAAAGAKLVATVQPTVGGQAAAGKQLTVSTGTWSAEPSGVTYAWLRCNGNGRICVAIAGATAATYTPTAGDVGHELAVRVTASSGTSAQPTLSATTAAVAAAAGPVPSATPTIVGTAQQGEKLSASPVTWAGTGAVTVTYQWYRCDALVSHCTSVHGATGAGYTLGARDAGKTLTLTITAKDSVAATTVYVSAVGLVGTAAPAAQPTIAGTTTLTVAGPAGATFTWLRCNANGRACAAIAGATTAAYTPTAEDAGHSLVATVDGALSLRTAPIG